MFTAGMSCCGWLYCCDTAVTPKQFLDEFIHEIIQEKVDFIRC